MKLCLSGVIIYFLLWTRRSLVGPWSDYRQGSQILQVPNSSAAGCPKALRTPGLWSLYGEAAPELHTLEDLGSLGYLHVRVKLELQTLEALWAFCAHSTDPQKQCAWWSFSRPSPEITTMGPSTQQGFPRAAEPGSFSFTTCMFLWNISVLTEY